MTENYYNKAASHEAALIRETSHALRTPEPVDEDRDQEADYYQRGAERYSILQEMKDEADAEELAEFERGVHVDYLIQCDKEK